MPNTAMAQRTPDCHVLVTHSGVTITSLGTGGLGWNSSSQSPGFRRMWAVSCGIVASGATLAHVWPRALIAVLLAGPLVCGASQVVNDWFDREVDAINKPGRPIPWGASPPQRARIRDWMVGTRSRRWRRPRSLGLYSAIALALLLAWAYSAPPARLKRNGWWGNAAVGLSYEGLAWVVGASIVAERALPPAPSLALALLDSIGTIGIMTLNDFKSVDGDRQMGIRSLPVRLGIDGAARVACATMAGAQFLVAALLLTIGRPAFAAAIMALVAVQLPMMHIFLVAPTQCIMVQRQRRPALRHRHDGERVAVRGTV